MKNTDGFSLELADWERDGPVLQAIRQEVFVQEQGVPEALERDGRDAGAWHVLARDARGEPVATGRLLPDGHIGRVAVRRPWRGRGLGRAVMARLIGLARDRELAMVELHAQTHALDFYAALGFRAHGEVFMEAGLPHRAMRLSLGHREGPR